MGYEDVDSKHIGENSINSQTCLQQSVYATHSNIAASTFSFWRDPVRIQHTDFHFAVVALLVRDRNKEHWHWLLPQIAPLPDWSRIKRPICYFYLSPTPS